MLGLPARTGDAESSYGITQLPGALLQCRLKCLPQPSSTHRLATSANPLAARRRRQQSRPGCRQTRSATPVSRDVRTFACMRSTSVSGRHGKVHTAWFSFRSSDSSYTFTKHVVPSSPSGLDSALRTGAAPPPPVAVASHGSHTPALLRFALSALPAPMPTRVRHGACH